MGYFGLDEPFPSDRSKDLIGMAVVGLSQNTQDAYFGSGRYCDRMQPNHSLHVVGACRLKDVERRPRVLADDDLGRIAIWVRDGCQVDDLVEPFQRPLRVRSIHQLDFYKGLVVWRRHTVQRDHAMPCPSQLLTAARAPLTSKTYTIRAAEKVGLAEPTPMSRNTERPSGRPDGLSRVSVGSAELEELVRRRVGLVRSLEALAGQGEAALENVQGRVPHQHAHRVQVHAVPQAPEGGVARSRCGVGSSP